MTLSTGLFQPATSWMVPNRMSGVACTQRDQSDQLRASDERNEVNMRVFECADLQDLRESHASTRSGTGSGCAWPRVVRPPHHLSRLRRRERR